ncbi:hypothetical protein [Pleionea sp. CnH1-48]|uniref:hypothetical protein n=1 Tax=Pleionea sp. CnH1-48 TaxID=2954494 RepID=UPI002097FB3F|nr:hypothetical protein [Pleionea sp. CnH1-48]MCO7225844.1 hypothetical protein [Pleionea sp. CnH1-48]
MKNWIIAAVIAAGPMLAIAEESEPVPVGSQGQQQSTPRHGISMDSVRSQYGEPAQILQPVGEPPITRWVYQDFTVYFEFDKVIHSVTHKA